MNWSLLASGWAGAVIWQCPGSPDDLPRRTGRRSSRCHPGHDRDDGRGSADPLLLRYGFDSLHRSAAGHRAAAACTAARFPRSSIHAPGTPAAAATLLDGYPMCQKGQAGKALSVAMFSVLRRRRHRRPGRDASSPRSRCGYGNEPSARAEWPCWRSSVCPLIVAVSGEVQRQRRHVEWRSSACCSAQSVLTRPTASRASSPNKPSCL